MALESACVTYGRKIPIITVSRRVFVDRVDGGDALAITAAPRIDKLFHESRESPDGRSAYVIEGIRCTLGRPGARDVAVQLTYCPRQA